MSEPSPAERLAGMMSGYWVAQMVYAAADLGLADLLTQEPLTAESLASATGTQPQTLFRLMRALASVGIFSEDPDGRFALTPLAEILRTDAPGSQRATVRMMVGQFYEAWGGLLESLRTGSSAFKTLHGQPFFAFLREHPEQARIFDDAMTAFNDRKTRAVLDAYDFSDIPVLADVGGGKGANLASTLKRYPAMRGILFDLPDVVARSHQGLSDVADRCEIVGGSFLEGVPASADAYLLRHIVHNWSDDQALAILKNVRTAMHPSARMLVVERVIPPGNEPHFGKLMDLTMLVVHGGRERTEDEFRGLFEAADLRLTRIVPTASDVSVIEGRPRGD